MGKAKSPAAIVASGFDGKPAAADSAHIETDVAEHCEQGFGGAVAADIILSRFDG